MLSPLFYYFYFFLKKNAKNNSLSITPHVFSHSLQMTMKMMYIVATLFLLVQVVQAVYHIKATHRNKKRKETKAKQHGKGDKAVTRPDQVNPYSKFLHFLATDYSTEGVVIDPSSPFQNPQSFTVSRSAYGGRPKRNRKSHGQRSVLVKVLELPVEDPRSLRKYPSLPQPDAPNTMTVITETGKILKGIAPLQWNMEEQTVEPKDNENSKSKNKKNMHKKVSILVKYLKL